MSRPPISRRKKILFSAIMTILVLAAANGAVVLYEKVQYGGTQAEKEGMYMTDANGRAVLRPGSVLEGVRTKIRINSLGFRGPELRDPKPENGFRIWCVGGSTTFDVFAPDDTQTWPAQLQAQLQKAKPDRTIEVINAGIPGEILAGSQKDFEAHFDQVQPDAIVIYHGPNDMRDVRFGGPAPPTPELEQSFALLRATRGMVNRKLPQLPAEWADTHLNSHKLGDLELRFLALIESAKARGVRVLIASHAIKGKEGSNAEQALMDVGEVCVLMQMHPEPVIHLYRDFNNMMAGMAERMNMPFADVRAAVPSDDKYWGDALHFTAAGSKLAAETLTREFLETGWL